MLFSFAWLKEYVDLPVGAEELAAKLSLSGLEAVAEKRYDETPTGVVVARITAVEPHPDADRLKLCTVDAGDEELTIVCGAPNAAVGLVSPLAKVGAVLPGGHKLKKSKIRGVESMGMLLAEDELGVSEDHAGLMVLDDGLAPGTPITDVIDFDDYIIEVDLTPNRGDCASVYGVARDAAAVFNCRLTPPSFDYQTTGQPVEELASVEVKAPELCPRYGATLMTHLEVKPSPWWMRDKLLSAGQRPINNLVDVTNFVMLELNQPLHAFNFDQVGGSKIIVRTAEPGEKFVSLDGQERKLDDQMLMICDAEKPVGLAGIMGGLNSEVEDDTTKILLEAAYFNPTNNRRTANKLNMNTEATYRFQRGMDQVGLMFALKRATAMMAELGGGIIHPGIIDEHPLPHQARNLELRVKRCNEIIGSELSGQQMVDILHGLNIDADLEGEVIKAVAPSWRPDLEREIDLVEEVARIYGLDNLPDTFPPMTAPARPKPETDVIVDKIGPLLAAAGLTEVVAYAFVHRETPAHMGWADDDPRANQLAMVNPLADDQAVMRTDLLPGLLQIMALNHSRGAEAVRIFEVGKTFRPTKPGQLPNEIQMAAGLLSGPRQPIGWAADKSEVDLWDVRAIVEKLIAGLKLPPAQFSAAEEPGFEPGTAGTISLDGVELGWLGKISRPVMETYQLRDQAWAFNLSADALLELTKRPRRAVKPIPRFPGISRDIALVVDKSLEAGALLAMAKEIDDSVIAEIGIFDLYQGKPLPDNRKSVGLRVRYQSGERTLTEEEITPLHERLTAHLINQTGGSLRQ